MPTVDRVAMISKREHLRFFAKSLWTAQQLHLGRILALALPNTKCRMATNPSLFLNAESMNRHFLHRFAGFQQGRRKHRLIWSVRVVLCFQTERIMTARSG